MQEKERTTPRNLTFQPFHSGVSVGAAEAEDTHKDETVDWTHRDLHQEEGSTDSGPPDPPPDLYLDHSYCKVNNRKPVPDETPQPDVTDAAWEQRDLETVRDTGVPLGVLNVLLSLLTEHASAAFPLSLRDQVVMTLMKLRTNCGISDLSKRFNVSQNMATVIILFWIDTLDRVLRPLVLWLPKETLRATMPQVFKEHFPNTTCILHISHILLQKTLDHESREKSYSFFYDKVKYVVAAAPCGLIMFVSAVYGAHNTDKSVTLESGIFERIRFGDEVMGDMDTAVNNKDWLLIEKKISMVTPWSLTENQGSCSQQIQLLNNHVERATRRLAVYQILSQVVSDSLSPKINKILRICSALVNLREENL